VNEQNRTPSDGQPEGAPGQQPWWSRPDDDRFAGPREQTGPGYGQPPRSQDARDSDPHGAPSEGGGQPYGQQPYGEQPYGHEAYGAGAAYGRTGEQGSRPSGEPDPWSRPSTQAGFPSGASSWPPAAGAPGGSTLASRPRRAGRGGLVAGLLALALVAGAGGGLLGGYVFTRTDSGVTDSSATTLGSQTPASVKVDRAPESVAGIAAKLTPSTVSIQVRASGGSGTGSGVVIRSDGYILTNNHVVASAANGGEIRVVRDNSSQPMPAEIVGRDPVTDLAVIRVKGKGSLPAAPLGRSSELVVGDPVVAIGSPLGLSGTVTTGIVSALNRTVTTPSEDGGRPQPLYNAIQTDAAINPGNSGGALVNSGGQVVGINSAIATLGATGPNGQGGSIGVGFAIPIDEAKSIALEIIRTGQATHPSIGVQAETVTASSGDRQGALVREALPGGAAAKAGLRSGDLVTKVDGAAVTSVDELVVALRRQAVGDTVKLSYVRSGKDRQVTVTLQDLRD